MPEACILPEAVPIKPQCVSAAGMKVVTRVTTSSFTKGRGFFAR